MYVKHNPEFDGMFVKIGLHEMIDFLGLFRDANDPHIGRDVSLMNSKDIRIRIREDADRNTDPDACQIYIVIVGIAQVRADGSALDLKRDAADIPIVFGRWLTDFSQLSELKDWTLPPFLVKGYIRHKAGDQL